MAVNVSVTPQKEVNRVEVLVRIVYAIVISIVFSIVGIALYVLIIVNFLSCLILAKRVGAGFLANVTEWITKVAAYFLFVTDERPPFIPKI